MKWRKTDTWNGTGTYETADGRFVAERDVRGGQSDDPENIWHLYENGELVDYFPTLKAAKDYAATISRSS